jgi:hypothetical protein
MSRPSAFFIPQFDDNVVVCIEFMYASPIYLRLFADMLPAPTRAVVELNGAAIVPPPVPVRIPCLCDAVYKWIISNPAYVFYDITRDGVVVIRHTMPMSRDVVQRSRAERNWLTSVLCNVRPPGGAKGVRDAMSADKWTRTPIKSKK